MDQLIRSWEEIRMQRSLLVGSVRRIVYQQIGRAWRSWIAYMQQRVGALVALHQQLGRAGAQWYAVAGAPGLRRSFSYWVAVHRQQRQVLDETQPKTAPAR